MERGRHTLPPPFRDRKGPASWASSFMVSRISGFSICLLSSGCACKGSRIKGLDLFITSPESPTTKSVPILRPSRPSRAISTASETVCFSTAALTWRFWEQISSNICAFPTPSTSVSYVIYRQPYRKSRLARLRPDGDLATVGDDYAPHYVEAEPGPRAYLLGRVEGLEDALPRLTRYPRPVVHDLDHDQIFFRKRP